MISQLPLLWVVFLPLTPWPFTNLPNLTLLSFKCRSCLAFFGNVFICLATLFHYCFKWFSSDCWTSSLAWFLRNPQKFQNMKRVLATFFGRTSASSVLFTASRTNIHISDDWFPSANCFRDFFNQYWLTSVWVQSPSVLLALRWDIDALGVTILTDISVPKFLNYSFHD